MIYCLDIEVVVDINRSVGATGQVIDSYKLESALARPLHSIGGEDAFPTLVEKASVLIHGLANAHSFLDGNKRTAWISATTFLKMHDSGVALMSDEESGQFVLDLMMDVVPIQDAALWLLDHLEDITADKLDQV